MNSIPAPADCENCLPTAEINGDGNTTTITHEPGCQHIADLRAREHSGRVAHMYVAPLNGGGAR